MKLLQLYPTLARLVPGAPGQEDDEDEDDGVGDDETRDDTATAGGEIRSSV